MEILQKFLGRFKEEGVEPEGVASSDFPPKESSPSIARERTSPASSPKETILLERKIGEERQLLGGTINYATLVKLNDNGDAVFKPYSGHEKEAGLGLRPHP